MIQSNSMMDCPEKACSNWEIVLDEDFQQYEVGNFSSEYTALEEFYYPEARVDQGPWQEIAKYHLWGEKHNPDTPNWKIVAEDGRRFLRHAFDNRFNRWNWKYPIKRVFFPSRLPKIIAIPALAAGDNGWQNYCVQAEVRPHSAEDRVGILFRIADGQHYYWFAIGCGEAAFLRRQLNSTKIIQRSRWRWNPGSFHRLSIVATGDQFRGYIDGHLILEARDQAFPRGRIGLASNIPATFKSVTVFKEPGEALEVWRRTKPGKPSNNQPDMVLRKKIELHNLHSGKTIRIGNLMGDGRPFLVMAKGASQAKGDNYNAIIALSAMDLEGNILWSCGEPSGDKNCLSSDLPFQVYDIDGDGRDEIICARNFHLEILDGATGKVRLSVPTPPAVPPFERFKNILGDCICICNLSGGPRPTDILVKDRYSKIWAYNSRLEPLWEYRSKWEMGHFPFTVDLNGDGRDEVLIGYSLLAADGRKFWELPLSDHADAVSVFRHPDTGNLVVVIAASDEGLIFADINGKIHRHLRLGHMQTVTAAKLIPGSNDIQIATNTYWGSPGIIFILDLDGNVLRSFQPSILGSHLVPVNWLGDGTEFLLLSAAPDKTGGLYDGLGRQAVSFPDDGHPLLCYGACDLDGDGLDELLCWDHDRMWIYSRDRSDLSGLAPAPNRYPLTYNESNYRSNISISRLI